MTAAELDEAIAEAADVGAILLTIEDWDMIMRPEPQEVRRGDGSQKPWTYRGLNVWISYDRPSRVISTAAALVRGLV